MAGLYPLKFTPVFHEKIWGGDRIRTVLGKDYGNLANCGESWELSGVEGAVSVVRNGFLEGNNLQELIEVYMGDLVGETIYQKFGVEFPLLLKFIDANDDLSIQVHPGDELSRKRHNAYGKTEMWYVIDAEPGAVINSGFNQPVTRNKYLDFLENGRLTDLLCYEPVSPGDVFFIPAGRVHAIGKGILLAEIQQTSDVTYRIYDYDRKDSNGNKRQLHTDLALDAIDFSFKEEYKTRYKTEENKSSEIVSCKYFTTNMLRFSEKLEKDYHRLDSFIIYMNLGGPFEIEYAAGKETVLKGETVLVPASTESLILNPLSESAKTLEIYINQE